MLPSNFDDISADKILALADEKTPESRVLDYKLQLPSSDGNKEFLADVSAFANAGGGDIVYGIAEETDEAGKSLGRPGDAPGITLAGETAERAVIRLHQMCQSGLDPAIPGLRINTWTSSDGRLFFVVRVPRSWVAPHMVSVDGSTRFFVRNDKAKYVMDREQIRQAFLFSDSIHDRLQEFRNRQTARVLAGTVGIPFHNTWKRIVHLVPLAGLNGGLSIDFRAFTPASGKLPVLGGTLNRRPNVDGMVFAYDFSGKHDSLEYLQVFRNGAIEHIRTGAQETEGARGDVPGEVVESGLIRDFKTYMDFYKSQAIPMPSVMMVSLVDVAGRHLPLHEYTAVRPVELTFDRDVIALPELWLENHDSDPITIRPVIEAFWQAGGHQQSPLPRWHT